MTLTNRKEPIPHHYTHWSEGNRNLFIQYMKNYVDRNYHGWELERIEDKGSMAVIRKKG